MTHTLIVGGTRGLGRVTAQLLASKGHHVSVIGRREPPQEDQNVVRIQHWVADLLDSSRVRQALDEAIGRHGPLSYLVFCQRYRGKENDWSGEIQVSLTATRDVIEAVRERFEADTDRGIVLVSSVFGERVGEGQPLSYHVGKAGLNHLARFYAVDLGRGGIRVNVITPFTFLKEESREFYLANEPLQRLYREVVPLGRMGTSEDSARLIAFLCSPDASFLNGQNIYVDGGLSLVWPETLARRLTGL
jgi:NAD(P)-dependent dehydrogenase (short-subunit alcohol dehydrogenase family)